MSHSGTGAVIESRVPGRVRFRIPKESRSQDLVDQVASALGAIEGVVDVVSNTKTGSVLVRNNPDVIDVDQLVDIARDAEIVEDTLSVLAKDEEGEWPEASAFARSISRGIKRFDRYVNNLTGGILDGKTLLIMLLLGTALSRALLGRKQAPAPWYALLWYGYSAFLYWNKPRDIC